MTELRPTVTLPIDLERVRSLMSGEEETFSTTGMPVTVYVVIGDAVYAAQIDGQESSEVRVVVT